MNEKGRSQSLVLAIALVLSGGIASAKSTNPNAIIGGGHFVSQTPSAIIGGDRRKTAKPSAIIGGDANAIIGGDANAIIGGDRRKTAKPSAIIGGDVDAIIGGDIRNLLVVGPVDAIDSSAGTFTVLGRTFRSTVGPQSLSRWHADLTVGVQPIVAVTGHARHDGKLAPTAVLRLDSQYVAGATRVLLQGRVGRVDYDRGRLTIGNQEIDVSSVLVDARMPISVGNFVAVIGTQPLPRGLVIASAIE